MHYFMVSYKVVDLLGREVDGIYVSFAFQAELQH